MISKVAKHLSLSNDLVVCDIANITTKSDMASMEYPIFSLTPDKDTNKKIFEKKGNKIEIIPGREGLPTVFDKDILIFAISSIMKAKNSNKPYSKKITFPASKFLAFSAKTFSGKNYKLLELALDRLEGTRLRTNIKTGDVMVTRGFGLIRSYEVKRKHSDGKVLEWSITLSDWLFNAIEANEVLTLNKNYFTIRSPLERRLYEIARKHCGQKKNWKINIDLLKEKCGTKVSKNKFKEYLKIILQKQSLLDYQILLQETDVFFSFEGKEFKKMELSGVDYRRLPSLKTTTYDKFRKNYKGYDPHTVEAEWREWCEGKETPKNPDAAFLAFAKKICMKNTTKRNY